MEGERSNTGEKVILFNDSIPPDYQDFCRRVGLKPQLYTKNGPATAEAEKLFDVISLDDLNQSAMERFRAQLKMSHRAIEPLEILADKSRAKRQTSIKNISAPWIEIDLLASSSDAARQVQDSIGFPCVIKPSNGLYSSGVVRVDTPEELKKAWIQVLVVVRTMKRKRGYGTVIAEKFIEGAEYMIDGFRYQSEIFCLMYHRKWPDLPGPTFHETACISRKIGDDDLPEERLAIATILEELGLDNTPFHAEFRRDSNGRPYLLELAPRLGGGGTSSAEMLRIATGLCSYSILHAINRQSLTEEMITPVKNVWAFEYDFFASASGCLKNITLAENYCRMRNAKSVFRYQEDGDHVQAPPMNTASFLTAFFEVDSFNTATQAIEEITKECPIETG